MKIKRKLTAEITAEVKALKAFQPVGKFAAKTKDAILWMIDELEDGVDDTAEEWNEMTDDQRQAVLDARHWKEGTRKEKPSEGWSGLVK